MDELLRDGRIGLFVVATLARRHGIRVQLQNNIYGGTQAAVVLPKALLDQVDDRGAAPARRRATGIPPCRSPRSCRRAVRTTAAQPAPSVLPSGPPMPGLPGSQGPRANQVGNGQGDVLETTARPPLPRRQPQASVVRPASGPPSRQAQRRIEDRGTEPPTDHMTGLAAEFLRGVRFAEEEDPSARD